MTVSVIVPTWQGSEQVRELVGRLRKQSLVTEIIVIDSSSNDGTAAIAREASCIVEVIPKSRFNHGGTRNLGARMAHGQILVFMTQDALPADEFFLEELTRPLRMGTAVAAYARQIPYPNAAPTEVFARGFNYPSGSHRRTLADVDQMGIKAFFFSNVASAINAEAFWAVGGFPDRVILNEDMLLCAKLLRAGEAVAYQAEAHVYHSHNYTLAQQFRRYFDIGAAMSQASNLLHGGHSGREGLRFAGQQAVALAGGGAWAWIPRAIAESGIKFIAFKLGQREAKLPKALKRKLSMHAFYW